MTSGVKTDDGKIDVLVLKFAHLQRKYLAKSITNLHNVLEETGSVAQQADIIAEIRALTELKKGLDNAIEEFRKDAQNAGALYPKRKN
jgi:hypothetical protein